MRLRLGDNPSLDRVRKRMIRVQAKENLVELPNLRRLLWLSEYRLVGWVQRLQDSDIGREVLALCWDLV
jgi:hypothetical protein